ncbi:hypothetical protein N2152v2_008947 [Parachlorella kessleri]
MAAAVAQQPLTAPVTRYQGVDKQSSGYKLLAAMGWQEGEGLGAERQGIKEHIKVKKKFENWGVGAVEAAHKARDWTTGMLDFHRVLSTLSEITSQHARSSGYESSSESEDEGRRSDASNGKAHQALSAVVVAGPGGVAGAADGSKKRKKSKKAVGPEVDDAQVAAVAAEAAAGEAGKASSKGKRKAAGKEKSREASTAASGSEGAKKRQKHPDKAPKAGPSSSGSSDSESGSNAETSDSDVDGGSEPAPPAQQQQQQPQPQPKRVKFATHVGRFKRREAAKMVKNYSTTDLAAILGGPGGSAAAAGAVDPMLDMVFPAVEIRAERPVGSSDSSGDEGAGAPVRGGGAAAASAPDQDMGQDGSSARTERTAVTVPEDDGKWWAGYFGRAARTPGAGAGPSGQPTILVHGFREEDQENLYNIAQGGKTQGRVGLGRSSMPKKVAGTRWAGKKTRLGSDSEDESEGDREQRQQQQQQAAPEGAVEGGKPWPGEIHLGSGVVIVIPPSKREQLEPLLLQQGAQPGGQQGQQPQQQQQQQRVAGPGKGGKQRKGSKQQQQQQQQEEASPDGADGSEALSGLKWRKLVLAQLKASGKSKLSIAKLSRAIVKARGLGKAARSQVERLVAEAAGSSSKLSIKEGVVRLA